MTKAAIAEANVSRGELDALNQSPKEILGHVERHLANLQETERLLNTDDSRVAIPRPSWIWGVSFSRLTLEQTLYLADQRIRSREPGYFITANLNYVMLTDEFPELDRINRQAAFIIADGMPIVWWSRLLPGETTIPERVAGSELIFSMNEWASRRGHRVFLLGGAEGVAETAAGILTDRYPGLQVAGTECPPFRELTDDEENAMLNRIREAKPDILFVAFGQPRGEKWIAEHCQSLGIPLCVQVGASFDFVVGNVSRAPKLIQKLGMEWAYRLAMEPSRPAGRYWRNFRFLTKAVLRDVFGKPRSGDWDPFAE
ncbi:MAG: WecB/TagA/CpsF family glycosyltransferase [Planctomycetota bacterium]|nr:WecB/TagA/CpsF family glycosyltransferase [Planctomycetota bacterium]MDA1247698.1 WecB/TagA/CpsF family glycosyltransferase [Planctomycetota bacterium]